MGTSVSTQPSCVGRLIIVVKLARVLRRSPPSGVSPWGSFADSIFRRARSSGAGLPGRSLFHAGGGGALHDRRSSRCSSDAELAFEDPVRPRPASPLSAS